MRYRSNFMTFFDRKWGFVDIVRAVIWQLGRALVTFAVVKSELVVVEELHFRLIVSLSTLLVSQANICYKLYSKTIRTETQDQKELREWESIPCKAQS